MAAQIQATAIKIRSLRVAKRKRAVNLTGGGLLSSPEPLFSLLSTGVFLKRAKKPFLGGLRLSSWVPVPVLVEGSVAGGPAWSAMVSGGEPRAGR
ncbi:unnamed protein product [Chondrus crispus]|uniref:Uncharacterized protein n=1 Tax=Chondrus crispus TaxID=2769 RepID=R7QR81_CHOCR|nr:unnamed protein product [Chondrus crispus]CDF39971.1 unnamed protein product [Chondrus crispus]|eukprot:XP_005710265.1 unnamed protein product [Chondrus crispus]